jgi:hypothetical protein
MPIRLTSSPFDRLVIGVGSGRITAEDLMGFMRELALGDLFHYRKIIDVSAATPAVSERELAAFSQRLSAVAPQKGRGPLAIVADSERGELARFFAQLASSERPTKVFRSIHDARQWLATMPLEPERRQPGRRPRSSPDAITEHDDNDKKKRGASER